MPIIPSRIYTKTPQKRTISCLSTPVVGWVAAFVARTQLYGFWQLIGLRWVVSCCCTLALVTTAVTQAYFYSTEVYVLGSCIVISLILFGIPVFRFHKKLRMLKAAERAELAESVAREMMQQATAPTDIHGDANDHETSSSPIINPNHMSDLEEIKIVAERKVEEKPDDARASQPDRDINRPDSDGSPTNKTTLKCLTFFRMKNKQPEPKEKAEETLKTDDTPKSKDKEESS